MSSSRTPITKATPFNEALNDVSGTVQSGDVPTNAQVTRVLDEASNLVEAKKQEAPLSDKGKEIADKLKNVVIAAKEQVLEKNANEEVQKMIHASTQATKEMKCSDAVSNLTDTALEAKDRATYIAAKGGISTTKDLVHAANALMKLGVEIVTSGEFRRLLVDLLDMLQEGLQSAQEKVQEGIESVKQGVQQAKEGVESSEFGSKEQAKRAVDSAGQKIGAAISETSKKAIDIGVEAKEKLTQLKEGNLSPSDLVPMSDERKAQFRHRFDELLDRIAANPSYNDAVRQIFATVEQFRTLWEETEHRAEEVLASAKDELKYNKSMQEAWKNGVDFLRRFVPEKKFDAFLADLKKLYRTVRSDPNLSMWWYDLKEYVRFALDHPKQAVSFERAKDLNALVDRAFRYSTDLRYNQLMQRVLREARGLVDAIKDEAQTNTLVLALRDLAAALFLDRRGNLKWKPEEIHQFRILLASLLLEEFKFIKLPLIEGETDEYKFRLQDAHLYAHDLLPDHIVVDWKAHADLNLDKVAMDQAQSLLLIRVLHMHAHIRNAVFWFRKKTGLIKIEDHGVVDINLSGKGASIAIELEANVNNSRGLKVRHVDIDLSSLDVHIVKSEHRILLTIFKPFWESSMRRSIEREIETRIRTMLEHTFANVSAAAKHVGFIGEVASVARESIMDVKAAERKLSDPDTAASVSHS